MKRRQFLLISGAAAVTAAVPLTLPEDRDDRFLRTLNDKYCRLVRQGYKIKGLVIHPPEPESQSVSYRLVQFQLEDGSSESGGHQLE